MSAIDVHEQKTKVALSLAFPGSTITTLKIGDFLLVAEKILVEIKIGADVHDYSRMGDELTRMNAPEYANLKKHLIYVAPYEIQSFREYKIVVHFAVMANVMPHHEPSIEAMIKKIKSLSQPAYQRPLQMSEKSEGLGWLGSILATLPGISDYIARRIEVVCYAGAPLYDAMRGVLGTKKDNTDLKVVVDAMEIMRKLKGVLE